MITRNNTSFIFNPDVPSMMMIAQVYQGTTANSMEVTYGREEAADQFEDILNKWTCLPQEDRTLYWNLISRFVKSFGYKIVEDGGLIPQ